MKRLLAIRRAAQRDHLLLQLLLTFAAYWVFLALALWLSEGANRNLAVGAWVAWVMSALALSLKVQRSAGFVEDGVPWVWSVATFSMGPVGAVVFPAIQAWRLSRT